MDRKVATIRGALADLDQLERAVGGEVIDSSDVLGRKIGKFMDSIANIFEEGRSMDESSMIQIPLDLFDQLDSPGANNPELYQVKMIEDAEARAQNLKKKLSDLEKLRGSVEGSAQVTS